MSEKCYQLFLSGIRTEKAREKHEYYLNRFLKETKLKNFTSLIEKVDETVVENNSIWKQTPLRDFSSKCIMNKHDLCTGEKCQCLCHPHNQQ
ncbi:MAG: hypothetical protein OES27_08955 [Nitrosopumilus sp.]|nr:hypothetical protein [Nitrosopumilus sp.]